MKNNFEINERAAELSDTMTKYALARRIVELENDLNKVLSSHKEIANKIKNISGWVSHVSKASSIENKDEWHLPLYRLQIEDEEGCLELLFLSSELREEGIKKVKLEGFNIVNTDYLFLNLPLEYYSDDPLKKIKAEALKVMLNCEKHWADNLGDEVYLASDIQKLVDKLERGES